MSRKWIKEDIVEDLKAHKGSSLPADKMPCTDEELQRIYAVCDTIGAPKKGPGQRPWTGEDVKDFIYLSIYTGLRISDVSIFNITKCPVGNDLFLRMHKTKKELCTRIPVWLVFRLREREKKYWALIFRSGCNEHAGDVGAMARASEDGFQTSWPMGAASNSTSSTSYIRQDTSGAWRARH